VRVGADDFVDVGLRNGINAGVTEGPRMLTAVHGIGSPGGHFDDYSFPPDRVKPWGPIEGICSGADQCREAVRYQMKWGADVIKIAAGTWCCKRVGFESHP
jgi:imidazolonepropionase-like amidohydrolase